MTRLRALPLVAFLAVSLGSVAVATADPPGIEPGTKAPVSPRAQSDLAGTTVIGQVATNVDGSCPANLGTKMNALSGGTQTYTVPSNGVLTSFSYNSGLVPGGVELLLLTPTVTANLYDVVARSSVQPVVASTLNTYPVRIPVQTGWQLGSVVTAANMNCLFLGAAGDIAGYDQTFVPGSDPQLTAAGTLPNARLNLAAVLEPDADLDGFGDFSQDLCPQSAATQAACPPPTTVITKAPARKTTTRKVKLVFSSVPGATYMCAVDGQLPAPCTSPFKKKLALGKHVVVVTATSSAGIPDPTPPSARFKIVRKR